MNRSQIKHSLCLLLTAAIWGTAFVAQSVGMEYIGPLTFNGIRSLIGAAFLVPCFLLLRRINRFDRKPAAIPEEGSQSRPDCGTAKEQRSKRRTLLTGGICCGIALAAASTLQQYGIMYTSVGKAGFLTAVYIVLVPILGLFFNRKCSPLVWISVALSMVGLYLLSMSGGFSSIEAGDAMLLAGAFLFAVHILIIDHFSPLCDGVLMSCIQFLVCGILCTIPALILEHPDLRHIGMAAGPILYAGILSCGVAYTLQIIGQRDVNPTVASLILSLESAISVLAGWVILHQTLTAREIAGCVIVFGAIVLAQIPLPAKGRRAHV